jgi:chromosome segregation ATPase
VAELKVELDRESCRYEEEIRKVGEELAAVHKVAVEQEGALEGSRARVGELEEAKAKLERKIEMLFENWERLKDENEKGEIASSKEFERLRAILSEKLAEIKELRADEHHQKEAFEGQLHDYRQVVRQKEAAIDELEEQLQARNERIEELTDKLEEMRKSISHNNEAETAAIYEKEFERVKEVFEDEKRELNYQYLELKEQNQQLREAIAEEERRREDLEATVADLEREVEETRKEYSSLHHLKSELENNFVEGVKCLNQ